MMSQPSHRNKSDGITENDAQVGRGVETPRRPPAAVGGGGTGALLSSIFRTPPPKLGATTQVQQSLLHETPVDQMFDSNSPSGMLLVPPPPPVRHAGDLTSPSPFGGGDHDPISNNIKSSSFKNDKGFLSIMSPASCLMMPSPTQAYTARVLQQRNMNDSTKYLSQMDFDGGLTTSMEAISNDKETGFIKKVDAMDVLCVQTASATNRKQQQEHPGNRFYWGLIEQFGSHLIDSSLDARGGKSTASRTTIENKDDELMTCAKTIVEMIRDRGGRFISQNNDIGTPADLRETVDNLQSYLIQNDTNAHHESSTPAKGADEDALMGTPHDDNHKLGNGMGNFNPVSWYQNLDQRTNESIIEEDQRRLMDAFPTLGGKKVADGSTNRAHQQQEAKTNLLAMVQAPPLYHPSDMIAFEQLSITSHENEDNETQPMTMTRSDNFGVEPMSED